MRVRLFSIRRFSNTHEINTYWVVGLLLRFLSSLASLHTLENIVLCVVLIYLTFIIVKIDGFWDREENLFKKKKIFKMFVRPSPGARLEIVVLMHLSSAAQQGAMCLRSFCFSRLIDRMIPWSIPRVSLWWMVF